MERRCIIYLEYLGVNYTKMSLELIDLRIDHNHPKTADFSNESKCIAELYWSFLKGYDTRKVKRCNIITSDNWGDKLLKYTDWKDTKGINISFNFNEYFASENKIRKEFQLEAIHSGMMEIAKIESWKIDPLLDAYNNCIENNLELSFILLKKDKSSPNRKLKINFKCYWDIDLVNVFYLIKDKTGKVIQQDIAFEMPSKKGEMVYHLKWKWKDNTTVLLEDKYIYGEKQSWEINVKEPNLHI